MQNKTENYYASLMNKASQRIAALEAELASTKAAQREPLAIVGMGCRFPGAADLSAFWQLLHNGVDAIHAVPTDRWDAEAYYDADPDKPGKTYSRVGGFLDRVDQFDAPFFGVAPREALMLDPQQRLLLEVTWETLEHAALPPAALPTNTGIFVGIGTNEYLHHLLQRGPEQIDAYLDMGNAFSTASGRLSYLLGIHGPCFSLDTACSSSLVAVHLACQSLRRGECDAALAGGVALMLSPAYTINLAKARMLSPEGRCKTFDAAADGYVRGEGCGMVLLKRLSDAQANGDTILAVIRGSAINQDGRTSGLTVPNGPAQQAVIRQALADGDVAPAQVGYIEAHGTGTSLGDPIEIGALGEVFGGRKDPLYIGSVKTNIGHLEAAAGVAGLIKAVLAVQHGAIPPHLHFHQPNPRIDWHQLPITIPTTQTPWTAESRVAGVSSFGFSGTNAHVVLEAWRPPQNMEKPTSATRPLHLLTLSAKNEAALQVLAQRYVATVADDPTLNLADICYTSNRGRAHFPHRLGVVAPSQAELCQNLTNWLNGRNPSAMAQGIAAEATPRIAFLFTGQGAQYIEMGHELYETQPVFRQALQRCDELLQPWLGESILEILYPTASSTDQAKSQNLKSKLDETYYTQPALFALEYALAQLWLSWGVQPSVVVGHSVGEYVAACLAGVFSLAEGLKLVAARGRLMGALPAGGQMVSVLADEQQVSQALAPFAGRVVIAAYNTPQSVVIAGDSEAVTQVTDTLQQQGVKTQKLAVSHAFHSPLMEPMLTEFAKVAQSITYHKPQLPLISNLTGQLATDAIATPAYWVRHVRQAVRFAQSINTLDKMGVSILLEIGPKPTLLGLAEQCLDKGTRMLPSLRFGHSPWETMLTSLSQLYVGGAEIDWGAFYGANDPDAVHRRIALPTYPFQRQRYWAELPAAKVNRGEMARPLVHRLIRSPLVKETICETTFSLETLPFLADHRVFGEIIAPGANHLALLWSAAALLFDQEGCVLEDIVFPTPLRIPEEGERKVQLVLTPDEHQNGAGELFSCQLISLHSEQQTKDQPPASQADVHAIGHLQSKIEPLPAAVSLAALQAQCPQPLDPEILMEIAAGQQISYGPAFRWVDALWAGQGEALGRLQQPSAVSDLSGYPLHPGLLDTCLQLTSVTMSAEENGETLLPFAVESIHFYRRHGGPVWWCHVRRTDKYRWDLQVLDEAGAVIAQLTGFEVRVAQRPQTPIADGWRNWLYAVTWQPAIRWPIAAQDLPAPLQIQRDIQPAVQESMTQAHLQQFTQAIRQLERLSLDYVLIALDKLGVTFQPGAQWEPEALATTLGIAGPHRRLFARLLAMLGEAGILQSVAGAWQVMTSPTIPDFPHAGQIDPAVQAEWTLLQRCGVQLAAVLNGSQNPLALLFPDGDDSLVTQIYQASPAAAVMNQFVQATVTRVLKTLPADRGMRILEIGAGTGSTTTSLLAQLPAERTEYVFTDIGGIFLTRAKEKFKETPFIHYQSLDIEQAPAAQGFAYAQYDLIVAANVLHATRSLRETVTHARQLLKPGGLLILLEDTERQRWVDLTFGLTDGWWRFTDLDVRPDHPILRPEQWHALLQQAGFTTAITLPDHAPLPLGQSVMVAQADGVRHSQPNRWLLFADSQGFATELVAQFQTYGQRPVVVTPGEAYRQVDEQHYTIRPDAIADYRQLMQSLPSLHGVVYLWGFDAKPTNDGDDLVKLSHYLCSSLLYLVQALTDDGVKPPALWLVTRNAQTLRESDGPAGVAQAQLWGMGKVVDIEHPELRCVRVDLDAGSSAADHRADVEVLLTELLSELALPEQQEDQLLWFQGSRYAARLTRYTQETWGQSSLTIHANRTYLLTGGLGGLGLQVAQWLVAQGAQHLVLLGRSAPTPAATQQIAALQQQGAHITVAQADVTNADPMERVLAAISLANPLAGIIHGAGVLDDGILRQQTWSRFEAVLAPKVQGAWHLHQLTKDLALDFFVLFSSDTALLGNGGQANHAAANAFLDALAHYRQAQGLPALSINWGAWAEIGAAAERNIAAQIERKGMGVIPPEQGIAALAALLTTAPQRMVAQVGVTPIDWAKFLPPGRPTPPFFRQFKPKATVRAPKPTIQQSLATAANPRAVLTELVLDLVIQTLGGSAATEVGLEQGFFELGMDSLMSLELRRRLQSSLHCELPSTIAFTYPSVMALVNYLAGTVLKLEQPVAVVSTPVPGVALQNDAPTMTEAQLEQWVDTLTDAEVDALLDQKLDQFEQWLEIE